VNQSEKIMEPFDKEISKKFDEFNNIEAPNQWNRIINAADQPSDQSFWARISANPIFKRPILIGCTLAVIVALASVSLLSNPESDSNFASANENENIELNLQEETAFIYDSDGNFVTAFPGPSAEKSELGSQNYFTDHVLQVLLNDGAILGGISNEERFEMVFEQGLKIYTTLDSDAQEAAEAAQEKFVPKNAQGLEMSLVSVNNQTGAVNAIVGGSDLNATQGLFQPGSSFKPFVLASLFEIGYLPTDTVDATTPCTFKTKTDVDYMVNGVKFKGEQTVAEALLKSQNCPFVRIGEVIGNDLIVDVSRRLGITTISDESKEFLSLPLGVEEVNLLEITGSYAAFANDGLFNKPWFIERVEDRDGNILYEHDSKNSRAISEQSARMVTEILEDNVDRNQGMGTGRRAGVVVDEISHAIAGKTGTTYNFTSASFVGFSDYFTTAVWVGHPDGNVTIDTSSLNLQAYAELDSGSISIKRGEGGLVAAPIFSEYMAAIHGNFERSEFKKPDQLPRTGRKIEQ